jgi:hypothetical protein
VTLEQELTLRDGIKGSVSIALLGAIFLWTLIAIGSGLDGSAGGGIGQSVSRSSVPQRVGESAARAPSNPPGLVNPAIAAELGFGEVVLEGFGQPGQKAVLFGDGAEMGSGGVDEEGRFKFVADIQPPIPDVFTFGLFDENGVRDPRVPSSSLRWAVTAEMLARPMEFTLVRPVDGGTVSRGKWVIAGTGKPGSQVRIQIDKNFVGKALVKDDGTWTLSYMMTKPGRVEVFARELDGFNGDLIAHRVTVTE